MTDPIFLERIRLATSATLYSGPTVTRSLLMISETSIEAVLPYCVCKNLSVG